MSVEEYFEPLLKRRLLTRVLKGIAVGVSFAFILAVIFLVWALETGRAVEAVRAEVLTELHDRCGVEAKFESLAIDPFRLGLDLTALEMRHVDGPHLLSVEQAIVSLQLLPLFYGRLQLDRVALLAPKATIALVDGRVMDLPRCLQGESSSTGGVVLGVRELTVERGRLDLKVGADTDLHFGDIGITLAPGSSGGVDVALGVDDGSVRASGRHHVLERVRLLGHLEGLLSRPRAIVVDALEIDVGRLALSGSGSIDLLGPVYQMQVGLTAPLDAVQDFVEGAPALVGLARLDVSVAGTAASPRAAGRIVVEHGGVDGYGFGDEVTADFVATPQNIELLQVTVAVADGRLTARGNVELGEKLTLSIETEAERLSMGRVLDLLQIEHAWIDYATTGRSKLAGTLSPLSLEGDFDYQVDGLVVYDRGWDAPEVLGRPVALLPPERKLLALPGAVQVAGQWRFDDRGVSFTEATLASGATHGNVDCRLAFDSKEGIRVRAQLGRVDFDDIGPIAGLDLAGRGSLSAELKGSYDLIGAVGTLDLADISIAGIPFGRATANAAWTNWTHLAFTSVEGQLGATRYLANVGVNIEGDVPLSISGEIPAGRLSDVLVPFGVVASEWGDPEGKVFARFALNGPVDRLTGPIDVSLEDLVVVEETAERGRFLGRMEQGRIVVEDFELFKHGARLVGSGTVDPAGDKVRARVRTVGARLSHIDAVAASAERLDGNLAFNMVLGGPLHAVTGTITARVTELVAGPERLGDLRLNGALRGTKLSVRGGLAGGGLSVDGAVQMEAGLPYASTVVINDLDVPRIMAGLEGHAAWQGRVDARAELSGSLVDWPVSSGQIALERAELITPSFRLETSAPARFELTRGVLSTKRLALTGPRTRLSVAGRFGGGVLDLGVDGRVDLAMVEILSPSVEKAGGALVLDGVLRGSPSAVNAFGKGRIEGGFVQWRGVESRLTGVSADLTFSQSSVLVDRAQGRFAGGRLSATGNVLLERFVPRNIVMTVKIEQIRPRITSAKVDIAGTLDGRLEVSGTPSRLVVRGDVDLTRGRASPKLDWQNLVGSRRVADVYDPSAEVLDLDLLVHTKEPLRVKNDDADLELKGDVRLTGTNERIGFLGTMTVVQGGRVAFIGREYLMEAGTIDLSDRYRFLPRYDLTLSSEACGARIRLGVVGTLDEVRTTYASNPEMDERDIVSCLVRGVRVRDLDQDLPSFASSALLKLSGVDREVKKVIPIDQIDVTTEYSSQARAYEPRVLLAKNVSLLDRPARLEYSSSLLRTNDQRAAIRVRLTPRLNLQLGWTSSEDVPYGDWGVDLKQRWEW